MTLRKMDVHNVSRPNFGITESRSTKTWLVRLTAEDVKGRRYTINRIFSWSANGGKERAFGLAQHTRDALLNHPDVARHRQIRGGAPGQHFHVQHKTRHKRAFAELTGISLVEDHKASGSIYWGIKASVGSSPTLEAPHRQEHTKTFSLKRYGLEGALRQAISHREERLSSNLYSPAQIQASLSSALKRFRKRWIRDGITLGDKTLSVTKPEWRYLTPAALREALPSKPFQIGVNLVVNRRKLKSGRHVLDAAFIAVEVSHGTRDVYFQRSIQAGLWPGFRDAIKAARRRRKETNMSEGELRRQYELWISGREKKLKALGLLVND